MKLDDKVGIKLEINKKVKKFFIFRNIRRKRKLIVESKVVKKMWFEVREFVGIDFEDLLDDDKFVFEFRRSIRKLKL